MQLSGSFLCVFMMVSKYLLGCLLLSRYPGAALPYLAPPCLVPTSASPPPLLPHRPLPHRDQLGTRASETICPVRCVRRHCQTCRPTICPAVQGGTGKGLRGPPCREVCHTDEGRPRPSPVPRPCPRPLLHLARATATVTWEGRTYYSGTCCCWKGLFVMRVVLLAGRLLIWYRWDRFT